MEQHPVPQDITGFQFKLIGDMTVKQFVYLAGGIVIAFVISRLDIHVFVKYPLLAFFAIGGAALAFLDVGRRPLDRIIASFFRSVYRDTRYVWKKSPLVPDILQESTFSVPTNPQPQTPDTSNKQMLEQFLESLPQKPKTNLDKVEDQKLNLIISNFKNLPFKKTPPPKYELKTPAPPYVSQQKNPVVPLASGYKTDTVLYPGQKIHFTPATNVRVRKLGSITAPVPTAPQPPPPKPPPAQIPARPPLSAKDYVVADSAGKLEKSTPLKKTVFVAPRNPSQQVPPKPSANPEEQKIYDLSQKNQALENQMRNIQAQVDKLRNEPLSPTTTAADFDRTLKNLLSSLQETERQRQAAVSELTMLKRKLEAQKTIVSPSLAPEEKPSVRFVSPITAKRAGLPIFDYAPNVINGIIIEPNGNVLSSVVLVVKDQKENPVRAFKSNKLGQFSIATPLPNGIYTIEVEKDGFDFDIIKLELKGEPVPPIEIKARPVPAMPEPS